jgi:hypothetical protein
MTERDTISTDFLKRRLAELENGADKAPLHSGGGGGTFDDMEARVKALESRADRIETKLDTLIEKVAGMEGELRRLPGYPGLFLVCGTLVGVVALIIRFLPALPPV